MSKKSSTPLGDKIRSFAAGYAMTGQEERAEGMYQAADVVDAEPQSANITEDRLLLAMRAGLVAFAAALDGVPTPPTATSGMTKLVRKKKVPPSILEPAPSTPPSILEPAPSSPPSSNRTNIPLGRCEMALLTVLSQRADKTTTDRQLAIFSGYRKSGTFYEAIRAIKKAGFVEGDNRGLRITPLGKESHPVDNLPQPGEALVRYWKDKLPKADEVLLGVLVSAYPQHLSAEELADRSGYQTSGSFWSALRNLRMMELTERHPTDRRLERASSELMGRNDP
jgi:hypothetical protein